MLQFIESLMKFKKIFNQINKSLEDLLENLRKKTN
jgi:hypothetical protein